jgi:hypothetical protein
MKRQYREYRKTAFRQASFSGWLRHVRIDNAYLTAMAHAMHADEL